LADFLHIDYLNSSLDSEAVIIHHLYPSFVEQVNSRLTEQQFFLRWNGLSDDTWFDLAYYLEIRTNIKDS
jgi:hypothetical protein